MNQVDFVGGAAPVKTFLGQVHDTRPSVAEEKAELLLKLGKLMKRPPPGVANGSVQITRRWLADRKKAEKVAASSRTSVPELHGAISMMRAYL